jgi:putative spermidine/putrescine transport system permease protein
MSQFKLWFRILIGILVVFLAAPILVVILVSFNHGQFVVFPPQELSFRWFVKVLSGREFVVPLWNSVKLASLATLCSALFAVPAALALVRRRIPGGDAIYSFLLSSLALPTIILAIGLLFFLNNIGLGNTFVGLLAGHVVLTIPYIMRTVFATYAGINREVEEAAYVLGANSAKTFFLITLPMIRPAIIAGGIFSFIISFDEVPVALLLTNADNITLPVAILGYLAYTYDPSVAAISTIQILIAISLLLLLEKLFGVKRIMLTTDTKSTKRNF